MASDMNIFKRMSSITAELTAVAKNLSVGEGKSAYKAVGEADVLAAVRPLEDKYGVYSYPVLRRIVDSDTITLSKTYNGNITESTKFFMRIETVYRFVNIDNPQDFVEVTSYGDGVDPQDKAPGKAMTYADKYALLKAYKVITGDDLDQYKSEEGKVTMGKSEKGEAAEKKNAHVCCDCLKQIVDSKTRQGDMWSAESIAVFSEHRYGKKLCPDCMKAAEAALQEDWDKELAEINDHH